MSEIKSRAYEIEVKKGDTEKQIKMKNKIREVLKMHEERKLIKEIADETGFSTGDVTRIIVRECTFVMGP